MTARRCLCLSPSPHRQRRRRTDSRAGAMPMILRPPGCCRCLPAPRGSRDARAGPTVPPGWVPAESRALPCDLLAPLTREQEPSPAPERVVLGGCCGFGWGGGFQVGKGMAAVWDGSCGVRAGGCRGRSAACVTPLSPGGPGHAMRDAACPWRRCCQTSACRNTSGF